MSDYSYSAVLICPAADQADANLLACALGHDVLPGRTFSVALSGDALEPATHYGCQASAQQSFIDLFAAASQGQLPPVVWEDYGLTVERVAALLSVIKLDSADLNERDGHFGRVIEANGLQLVSVEEGGL